MSFVEIFVIAVALSIDAVVVALCWSANQKQINLTEVMKFSVVFGGFQALMPILGWFAGDLIVGLIGLIDHWIAFALLLWVAYSMVKEAIEGESPDQSSKEVNRRYEGRIQWTTLIVLALATSLDALAIGFSFAMLKTPIMLPSLVIGVVCAVLTAISVSIGKALTQRVQRHTNVISLCGAAVLVLIGLKILWEHGVFN